MPRVWLSVQESLVLRTLISYDSEVTTAHCKKQLLWWKLMVALTCGHKHNYSEDDLMGTWCPLNKTTVAASLPGLMTSTIWTFDQPYNTRCRFPLWSGHQIQSESCWLSLLLAHHYCISKHVLTFQWAVQHTRPMTEQYCGWKFLLAACLKTSSIISDIQQAEASSSVPVWLLCALPSKHVMPLTLESYHVILMSNCCGNCLYFFFGWGGDSVVSLTDDLQVSSILLALGFPFNDL